MSAHHCGGRHFGAPRSSQACVDLASAGIRPFPGVSGSVKVRVRCARERLSQCFGHPRTRLEPRTLSANRPDRSRKRRRNRRLVRRYQHGVDWVPANTRDRPWVGKIATHDLLATHAITVPSRLSDHTRSNPEQRRDSAPGHGAQEQQRKRAAVGDRQLQANCGRAIQPSLLISISGRWQACGPPRLATGSCWRRPNRARKPHVQPRRQPPSRTTYTR
jgi:hypothetical protein